MRLKRYFRPPEQALSNDPSIMTISQENTMKKILIVDDDSIEREVLSHLLADKYETEFADNGEHAVEKCQQFSPDLVLLDIEMPVMNGFDACRQMRQSGFTLPIIFLSFLNSKKDKLKAYNAGGDDFIGKPYDIPEMLAKLEINLSRYQKEKDMEQSNREMMEMANRSMTDMSYMGRIIQYLESLHHCKTFEDLSNKVFNLLKEFGSCASLVIYEDEENAALIRGCEDKPMESNLLLSLKGQRRILEFGNRRCACNWQYASLLVKNMPEDEVKNGQMKDYLGYVMNGLESAVKSIIMQKHLQQSIVHFKDQNRHLKLSIMEVIENIEISLDELFQRPDVMGVLPLDVEDKVIKIAENSRIAADQHFSSGLKIEEELNAVLELFNEETEQQSTDAEDDDDSIMLF